MHELGALRAGSGAQPAPVPFAPPEKRRSTLARWFDNWMRSLGMALVLFLIIRTFLIEAFQIPSGSMERTLLAGDFLFVNKAVYGAQIPGTNARLPGFESPRRSDIIVFAYPKNPELNYVKRVIGVPGDRVEMRAGEVRVNGKPLAEPYVQRVDPGHDVSDPEFNWQKDYLNGGAATLRAYRPTRDTWGPLLVPPGKFFVLGDNRDNSADSRYWGFVDAHAVKGRPLVVYFSYDPEALDKLVRSNLRFVVSVAKKYQNQGVSLSDLINEGNLGLIRAAHKFDETKGIKFISYAVWWIRQAILQALAEQSRIVRVPLNRAGTLHRIGKRSASLLQELGREPTVEEIAEGMDISQEEVAKTLSISQAHLSLDAPLTPGEDNKLLDYLPDTQNPGPDDEIFEHALTESIEEVLATLKDREAKILRLYFGLEGQEPMTLEEIGSLLGITRERVRQIKEKALARLRHVSRARALESFLF